MKLPQQSSGVIRNSIASLGFWKRAGVLNQQFSEEFLARHGIPIFVDAERLRIRELLQQAVWRFRLDQSLDTCQICDQSRDLCLTRCPVDINGIPWDLCVMRCNNDDLTCRCERCGDCLDPLG